MVLHYKYQQQSTRFEDSWYTFISKYFYSWKNFFYFVLDYTCYLISNYFFLPRIMKSNINIMNKFKSLQTNFGIFFNRVIPRLWNSRKCKTGIQILALSLLVCTTACMNSADSEQNNISEGSIADTTAGAAIDLGVITGPATYRGSGFLWSISYDEPHDSLVLPLKIQLFRSRITPWKDNTGMASIMRVSDFVPRIQVVLSDEYNLRFPYRPQPKTYGKTQFGYSRITSWPGDNDFSLWEDVLEDTYEAVKSKDIDVEWDLWEEPNWSGWWKPSKEQFFETWAFGVKKLRELDSQAVFVGPSITGFDPDYLKAFLLYAKEHDVLPDVLSWHEIHDKDNPTEIPEHAEIMREFMDENGIDIQKFDINEVVSPNRQTNPGLHVWYLANMEEAGIYGACKATWRDENEKIYNASVPTLGGFLTYPELQPRSTWWVMKAYADISGDLVEVKPDSTMEAVAGLDYENEQVRILLGRSSYGSEEDVVKIRNLDKVSWLSGLDSVHVVANRIPNSEWDPLPAPILIMNSNAKVQQSVLRLNFPEFGHNEALEVVLTAPGN